MIPVGAPARCLCWGEQRGFLAPVAGLPLEFYAPEREGGRHGRWEECADLALKQMSVDAGGYVRDAWSGQRLDVMEAAALGPGVENWRWR